MGHDRHTWRDDNQDNSGGHDDVDIDEYDDNRDGGGDVEDSKCDDYLFTETIC